MYMKKGKEKGDHLMGKNNGDLHKLQQTNLTYNGFFFL